MKIWQQRVASTLQLMRHACPDLQVCSSSSALNSTIRFAKVKSIFFCIPVNVVQVVKLARTASREEARGPPGAGKN